MDSLIKNRRNWGIYFFILVLAYSFVRRHFETKKVLKWHFKGAVEHVRYDDKKTPEITINHERYYLYYAIWDDHIQIHVGDTVIKEKGSLLIKLIRKNSKDTIYNNNGEIHIKR